MANGRTALMSPELAMPGYVPQVATPQPPIQISGTETSSKSVLGPVTFTLSNLNVAGSSITPADPSQNQYIVASNEPFTVSLMIEFNQSPLTKLLMCLGTTVTADFGFEGFGKGPEGNVQGQIVTVNNQFVYKIEWTGTAQDCTPVLTPGLYEIGATVTVGPAKHSCSPPVIGYGYIEEILLQIYPV
ncbi:MAG TPA: hypothetical protein V6D33_01890 [Cyanophyceae cyanobacterium]